MGFDKIVQILDPRYYDDRDVSLSELFALAELLVAPRGNDGAAELQQLLRQPQNQRYARFIHAMPFNPAYRAISSTQLRQARIPDAREAPQEVRLFMRETRAYAPPVRRSDGSLVDYYQERVDYLRQMLQKPVS